MNTTLLTITIIVLARFLSFSQTGISVDYPNGGETINAGSSYNIQWTDFPSQINTTVNIYYSINAGSTWISIKNKVPNNGTYNWTVPNTPSTQYLVKISTNYGSNATDISDNVFTIVGTSTSIANQNNASDNFLITANTVTKEVLLTRKQDGPAYSVLIYDLLGNTIYHMPSDNNSTYVIKLPSVSAGVYIVKIVSENGIIQTNKIKM